MASTEDKAVGKETTSSWKDSIYNPRTGELLGRTASSWGEGKRPPHAHALTHAHPSFSNTQRSIGGCAVTFTGLAS